MRTRGPRGQQVVQGLLSGSVLLLVAVGIPVVLVLVGGSPLPHGLVHALRVDMSLRQLFARPVADSWIVHAAFALAWMAWLWLSICVVVESRRGSRVGLRPVLGKSDDAGTGRLPGGNHIGGHGGPAHATARGPCRCPCVGFRGEQARGRRCWRRSRRPARLRLESRAIRQPPASGIGCNCRPSRPVECWLRTRHAFSIRSSEFNFTTR